MFINKSAEEKNNVCGEAVAVRRKQTGISRRELADRLQLSGLDIDKNAVQRIECGKRFVTDIELVVLAKVISVDIETLLGIEKD